MTGLLTFKAKLSCSWLSQNQFATQEYMSSSESDTHLNVESQLGSSYCYKLLYNYIYGTWVDFYFKLHSARLYLTYFL